MGDKKLVPYYPETCAGVSLYVRHWLDKYRDNNKPKTKEEVLKKLTVVFSEESELKTKVLADNEFKVVFKEKIRTLRVDHLKMFLMEIDKDRYGKMDYKFKG